MIYVKVPSNLIIIIIMQNKFFLTLQTNEH